MIEKATNINNEDLKRVADIWIYSNIDAHSFIDEDYWKSNYEMVKEMLHKQIYIYIVIMTILLDLLE